MASPQFVRLGGTTAKEKAEAANLAAFIEACPNFAGRTIVDIQRGGDPPDFLCLDGLGKRIGVELVQWINEQQTGPSKRRFSLEESYTSVIRSMYEQPPKHIGMVFINAKDGVSLATTDAAAFRNEVYKFVADIDAAWLANPEWHDPQGYDFTDFAAYPMLARHLSGLDVHSRERFVTPLGANWLTFHLHGGAYTPDWMREALLANVLGKVVKYSKPHNKTKLQQQRLDEFYLLAYYDEAVLYNTPYGAPGFGFREIGALVTSELARNAHPFEKVFLYSPLETAGKVLQVWPFQG
jgi:hypothetical protein